jgi:preprotein translocase subunit SecA
MKEGDAIEHSWLTSSVQKAQRKVEQRNYEIRKSLLEYDEVMEHQRSYFYTLRQQVLEGRQVSDVGMSYVAKSIEDAVGTYLDRGYVQGQVAEWCRQTLDVSVDPAKLPTDDQRDLENRIRDDVRNDIQQTVDVTVGEYVSQEVPQEEWDWRGLVAWAKTRYGVEVTVDELKDLDLGEVRRRIADAATELAEQRDLSELAKFMDKLYGERQLTAWAKDKFGIEVTPEEISKLDGDRVVERLVERARDAYRFREVVYPVQFILDMVFEAAKQDGQWAAAQLVHWANARYELNWTPESVFSRTREELGNDLVQIAQTWWTGGELEKCVDAAIAQHKDDRELAAWASRRFSVEFDVDKFIATADKRQMLIDLGRTMLRAELTQLERFVLVQVLDTAWKDHLYAMDQLKEAVGLRGFAERDPRIEYKREGGNLFRQMQASVRDRVTDLIFRARLTAAVEQRSVYQDARAAQPQAPNAVAAAAAVARSAPQGDGQTPDGQPAESPEVQLSRHARRAKAAEARSTPPAKPDNTPAFKERKKKSR